MACRDMLAGLRVSDVMKPCTVFISSREPVTTARAMMRVNGLRTLPVVDGGRLEGILTPREVMQVTSTRSNIPVSGVMFPTRLLVTAGMPLSELARQMAELDVNDMPVLQNPTDRTVVGLVKMEDVLRKISSKFSPKRLVESVMTKEVVSCTGEDDISKVWEQMEQAKYSGIPVVSYDRARRVKRVVGMISRSDIIGTGTARISEESRKGRASPKVKTIMRTPALKISPKAPVVEAVDLMIRKNIGRLPVVENDDLVGIITRYDVVAAACG
ncbi:MAG: CBS domain-containing protein [Candidatus Hadarchaeota archaeon]